MKMTFAIYTIGVDEDEDFVDNLTQAHKKFNKEHQQGRARVEGPYGWAKRKFTLLRTAWREREENLDDLVKLSLGLYNVTRRGL